MREELVGGGLQVEAAAVEGDAASGRSRRDRDLECRLEVRGTKRRGGGQGERKDDHDGSFPLIVADAARLPGESVKSRDRGNG